MQVGLVGDDPALTVLREQIAPAAASIRTIAPGEAADVEVPVVSDETGSDAIETVNDLAVETGGPFLVIERGGVGGARVSAVQSSIAVLDGDGPCYTCLRTRIQSGGAETGPGTDGSATVDRIAGAHAGALLAEILRAAGTAGPGDVITLPYAARTLLPLPGCPDCGGAPGRRWGRPSEGDERALEAASEAAELFLDRLLGPVSEIGEARSMPLPYYLASLAATAPFSDADVPPQAAGVAEDWNLAFVKGMGEALERYAAACYREDQFRRADPAELPDALPIGRCVRPADRDPVEGPIRWVPGERLADGEDRWIPAELAVFPPPEPAIRPAITSGLALGNTPAETALSGLLEVLERDATMLSWYSTFEPVGISVEADGFERLVRRAATEDLDVHVTLLTQDVDVPVVGAYVVRPETYPRFAAGSAAAFDGMTAAIDALREALQNWMELAEMGPARAGEEAPRLAGYAQRPNPPSRLVDPDVTVPAAEVGVDGSESVDASLAALVERVEGAGMTPFVSWLTTRDLAAHGFAAARVVVPEAQPLILETPYFGERAETVPDTLGFEPVLDRDAHPFP